MWIDYEFHFAFIVYISSFVVLSCCCAWCATCLYYKYIVMPPIVLETACHLESEKAAQKLCQTHEENAQIRAREISFFQKQQAVFQNNQAELVRALSNVTELIEGVEGSPKEMTVPSAGSFGGVRPVERRTSGINYPKPAEHTSPTPRRTSSISMRETFNKSKFAQVPAFASTPPAFADRVSSPQIPNEPELEEPSPPSSGPEDGDIEMPKLRLRSHTFHGRLHKKEKKKTKGSSTPTADIIKKPLPFKFRMPTYDRNNLAAQAMESLRGKKMNIKEVKAKLKQESAAILPLNLKFDAMGSDTNGSFETNGAVIGQALDVLLDETVSHTTTHTTSRGQPLTKDELFRKQEEMFQKELKELDNIDVESCVE